MRVLDEGPTKTSATVEATAVSVNAEHIMWVSIPKRGMANAGRLRLNSDR
jgi:hypothetical protein